MKKALGIALLSALVGCSDSTGGGKLTITKHDNGKTASRGYMLNDHIKVGDWVYFFEDGKREKEGGYVEDQMHGTWTFWLPDGSESWTANYKNGEGSKNGMFAEIGTEIRDEWIRDAKEAGVSDEDISASMQRVLWGHSGTKMYRESVKHGPWMQLDEHGKMHSEGTYKNGKQEGVRTLWHANGQKSGEVTYKHGKREGVWTYWHDNGQKGQEGTYKDGKKEGIWTLWDKQTNALQTETYKKGKLVK